MNTPFLDTIMQPRDLKKLSCGELAQLADEMRMVILSTVSHTGGHLAANLGVVEITLALHYLLDSPKDKIVWDVGHQCYPHKLVTGRKDKLHTIRQTHGLSGFPNRQESPHDHFTVGHASTAISQALGLAVGRDARGGKERIVAVCGDGSLTGGLSYEGLNNIGHMKTPLTIILNDNEMAISKSIGAMSGYLNKIITNPLYNRVRSDIEKHLKRFPSLRTFLRHAEEGLKNLIVPGMVFEELGLRYFGPIDGHDLPMVLDTLKHVLNMKEPCLLHILTKKGKGYNFAEQMPHKYHSAAPFDIKTGKSRSVGIKNGAESAEKTTTFTQAFSSALMKCAGEDEKIVAITAAMPEGTGLVPFQEKYPKRFFDVGIAEEHALTFAGALASTGLKPVVAIYSTFMQRAYDQLIHDVALQRVNVTVCLDRAGLVGDDGPTHHGVFDFAFLRTIPECVVAAPCDETELHEMLSLGIQYPGLFALRYPKAEIPLEVHTRAKGFRVGEGEVLVEGTEVVLMAIGSMVRVGLDVVAEVRNEKIDAALLNMRFVKPLDEALVIQWAKRAKMIVTIEEHVRTGGLGSAVVECLQDNNLSHVMVKRCALPDTFIEHGERTGLLNKYGLSKEAIVQQIKEGLKQCKK